VGFVEVFAGILGRMVDENLWAGCNVCEKYPNLGGLLSRAFVLSLDTCNQKGLKGSDGV